MQNIFTNTNLRTSLDENNQESAEASDYLRQGLLKEFPKDINSIECKRLFEENETNLKYETITNFTFKIKQAVINLDNIVELVFPAKLPSKYKKEIAKTLLERFNKFIVVNNFTHLQDEHTVAESKDINDNIDKIFIHFKK